MVVAVAAMIVVVTIEEREASFQSILVNKIFPYSKEHLNSNNSNRNNITSFLLCVGSANANANAATFTDGNQSSALANANAASFTDGNTSSALANANAATGSDLLNGITNSFAKASASALTF